MGAEIPEYTKEDGFPFGYDVKDGCSEETWDYGSPHGSKKWNNPHLRTELPHHTDVQSQLNGQRGGVWAQGGNGGLWQTDRNGNRMKAGNQWGLGKWNTVGSGYFENDEEEDEYDNCSFSTAGGVSKRTLLKTVVEGG